LAGDVTEESPKICKPYLDAKSFIIPYVKPYYDSYALPYVENARPYAENFHQNIYTPAVNLTKHNYDLHAAPRVDQVRLYGTRQWEELVNPQIQAGRALARKHYDSTLAPQIRDLTAFIRPHYAVVQEYMQHGYSSWVLPTYDITRPYAERIYNSGYNFSMEVGLPYAKSAWASTTIFFDRIIWPRLRILYGENVEPQLVRIGERLGRYRDGRKIKAVVDDIDR
jgi:hypothetical protein